MKFLPIFFLFGPLWAYCQPTDQIQAKAEPYATVYAEIETLSRDPLYLQYNIDKLIHTNFIQYTSYDREGYLELVEKNKDDLCSETAIAKFKTVQGGAVVQKFVCSQREILGKLREKYPTVASDVELMKRTYRFLVNNSKEYAVEYERIKGMPLHKN